MNDKKAYIIMSISTWFWAGAFIAGKYCAPYIPPLTLVFLRFLIAAIVLKPVLMIFPLEEKYKLQKKDFRIQVLTGIIGMFGYHVFFFMSLHHTTAINASIIAAVNPVMTVVFGALLFRQFITRPMLAGIILSLIGVLMTITGMDLEVITSLSFNRGDILMITAMTMWSLYIVVSKKTDVPPIQFTYNNFIIATVLSFPLFLWENPLSWLSGAPLAAWVAVVYMAVCPSVFSYCGIQMSIKTIGSQRSAIFFNLVPACSMLLAVLILGEVFEIIKLATMLIIIAGVVICQYFGARAQRAEELAEALKVIEGDKYDK